MDLPKKPSWWIICDEDFENFDYSEPDFFKTVRRLKMPYQLNENQLELLKQCEKATADGNLISKEIRDQLFSLRLIDRFDGLNYLTREGLIVLDTLNLIKR